MNNLGLDGSDLDRHDTNHSSTGIWLGNGSQNSGYDFKEDLAMQSQSPDISATELKPRKMRSNRKL